MLYLCLEVYAVFISIILRLSTEGCRTDPEKRGEGDYTLIGDGEDDLLGLYDKPLPCFGCGIGWFSYVSSTFSICFFCPFLHLVSNLNVYVSRRFLLGFVFPLMWYYATILYFRNYYLNDPRERTGLATCAIAVSIFLWHSLSWLVTETIVVLAYLALLLN